MEPTPPLVTSNKLQAVNQPCKSLETCKAGWGEVVSAGAWVDGLPPAGDGQVLVRASKSIQYVQHKEPIAVVELVLVRPGCYSAIMVEDVEC